MDNRRCLGMLLATAAFFSCNKEHLPVGQPFREATVLEIRDPRFTAVNCRDAKTFRILTDGDYKVSADNAEWLDWEQTDSTLKLWICGPLSDTQDRKADVVLESGTIRESISVTLRKAVILEQNFNEGCLVPGNMAFRQNAAFGKNTAVFTHTAGTSPLAGWLRADFAGDKSFSNRLSDGFSVETILSVDDIPSEGQMCAFGCYCDGGFRVVADRGKLGADVWLGKRKVSLRSKDNVQAGRYYHLVFVWDAADKTAKLYIDAKLEDNLTADGFSLPAAKQAQWLCVGGNCSKNGPEMGWNGEIVAVKVCDAVFDGNEVGRRFKALPEDAAAPATGLWEIRFIPETAATQGSPLTLRADGMLSSDVFSLHAVGDGTEISCSAGISGGRASISPGGDLKDGLYRIDFTRNGTVSSLGTMSVRFTDESCVSRRPKVVAHRGVHNTGESENSIAALRLAQEAGYYGSETDVWLSADDSLMVNHDGRIGGYELQTSGYSTLKGIRLDNGESLPSLYEYLMQTRKSDATKLIIEIKDHSDEERTLEAARKTVAMVQRLGMEHQVEYIAFSHKACLLIHSLDAEATIGYLNGDIAPEQLKQEGIGIMDYSSTAILNKHPEYIDEGHKIGIATNVWTVNEWETIMQCIAHCADYITTDCPQTVEEICSLLF